MKTMNETGSREVSNFNEAGLQIARLNNTWNRCHQFSTKGKYKEWFWELCRAWIELRSDAIRLKGGKKINIFFLKNKYFQRLVKKNLHSRSNLFNVLSEYEGFLRYLQDKAGKGGSYEDENASGMSD